MYIAYIAFLISEVRKGLTRNRRDYFPDINSQLFKCRMSE